MVDPIWVKEGSHQRPFSVEFYLIYRYRKGKSTETAVKLLSKAGEDQRERMIYNGTKIPFR